MDPEPWAAEVVQQILALAQGMEAPRAFHEMILAHLRKPAKVLEGESGFRWGLLPLLTAEACSGVGGRCVPVGAAMEFFVAAGDVLDDLADLDTAEAVSPQGRAQLSSVAAALLMLTQQGILLLADREVQSDRVSSVSRSFAQAGLRAASGQFLDVAYEQAGSVTTEECLAMTALKSGSLVRLACEAGALVATQDPPAIAACAEFGLNLGLAKQLLNDIDGLWAVDLNKSDIPRRKKTLPVVYGLRWSAGPDAAALARAYGGKAELTEEEVSAVRAALRRSGALYYTLAMADIHRQRARAALQVLPASPARDALLLLAASPEED